jgi:FAD/FMN-containing dehydrogenase
MKSLFLAALAAVLFAGQTVAHTAILPPFPDKALTANSSEAPAGCKFLPSDKGWPADHVWKSNFPGIFKKLRGTVGPDWMVQAKNVADVQKVVNFAREHNVRLTIITTGHGTL